MDYGSFRAMKGDILLSPSLPRLGIRISSDFIYLGNLYYISSGTHHVEQFIFLSPNGIGHVTRMLLIQFAGYLSNKEGVYVFSTQQTIQLEGEDYFYDTRVIDIDDYIKRLPNTELAHAADYIRQRAYTLAGDMLYQRFTRLASSDQRNEFVIAYLESIDEGTSNSSSLSKASASPFLEHALGSFTIQQS